MRITTNAAPGRYADGTPFTLLAPHYSRRRPRLRPAARGRADQPARGARRCSASGCSRPCRRRRSLDHADPGDEDGDGISGRANRVVRRPQPRRPGRSGASAGRPTRRRVEQQNAGAFNGDIGITSPIFTDENCPSPASAPAPRATTGGQPGARRAQARPGDVLHAHARGARAPRRRRARPPTPASGVFARLGCDSCHLPELRTGDSDIAANCRPDRSTPTPTCSCTTWAPGLADGRPDGLASGSRVAHAAAVGHRPRRGRQPPHALPPRRPRPQPRRGDPLARRRGAPGARGVPQAARARATRAARLPRIAVARRRRRAGASRRAADPSARGGGIERAAVAVGEALQRALPGAVATARSALRASCARGSGASARSTTASASSRASARHRRPVIASVTMLVGPPSPTATTGSPQACASSRTWPNVSVRRAEEEEVGARVGGGQRVALEPAEERRVLAEAVAQPLLLGPAAGEHEVQPRVARPRRAGTRRRAGRRPSPSSAAPRRAR